LLNAFHGDIDVFRFHGDIKINVMLEIMISHDVLLIIHLLVSCFVIIEWSFVLEYCVEERYIYLLHTRQSTMWLTFLKDDITRHKNMLESGVLDLVIATPTGIPEKPAFYCPWIKFGATCDLDTAYGWYFSPASGTEYMKMRNILSFPS